MYGNSPSPSPSYPQEIEVVRGKNIAYVNTSTSPNVSDFAKIEQGKTYTFSMNVNGSISGVNLRYGETAIKTFYGASGNISHTFVAPITGTLNLNGYGVDNFNGYEEIQLEPGSQATSYLPYNTIEATIRGKNILNTANGSIAYKPEGTTITIDSNGVINASADMNYASINIPSITLKAGKTYTFKRSFTGSYNSYFVDTNNNNVLGIGYNKTSVTATFETDTVINKLNSALLSGDNHFQLETGSTATDYEPYITPITKQLSLGEYEFAKIGNYRDYIWTDRSTGKWYVHKAVYKIANKTNWIVDSVGSNNRAVVSLGGNGFPYSSDIGYANANAISNCLRGISQLNQASTTEINNVAINNANMYIKFDDTINTKELIKAKLDSMTNLVICYVPATVTDTEITGTLKDQLEAWYNSQSFTGTTIIEIDGQLPLVLKVRALKAS